VQNATLPEQRVVRARLDQIAASADREGVSAPAVVVIGAVVNVLPVESDQPASI
jgi:siroheme synthase